jgi:uncharacterized protein YjbJ (UPF0337 family)
MDEDRRDGVGKQVSGSLKEAIGTITGDSKSLAEGTAERTAGTLQNDVGGANEPARSVAED